MRTWITITAVCLFFISSFSLTEAGKPSGTKTYGAEPTMGNQTPLSLSQALQKEQHGKAIRIKALVQSVCKVKGCWMIISDGKNSARVTFKDYSFFVPKNCGGKKIIAEGTMKETIVSEADARHYAEDEGATKKEIENIKGDQKEYSFIATSVTIL